MNNKLKIAIKIISGRDAGKIFPVEQTCYIGCGSNCDVELSDPGIASMHAQIRRLGDTFRLTDLTSKPDIRVNNKIIKSREINSGDRIRIANTVMEIISTEEALEQDSSFAPDTETIVVSAEDHSEPNKKQEITQVAEPADARDVIDQYRRKSYESPPETNWKPFLHTLYGVIALALLAVTIMYIVFKKSEKIKILKDYRATVEFAEQNPDKTDLIIDKYKLVLDESIGKNSQLEGYLRLEIEKLIHQKTQKDKELKTQLELLDNKAGEFIAQHDYEGAINVYYDINDESLKSRVLTERTNNIIKITHLKEEFVKQQTEQVKLVEAEKANIVEIKLKKITAEIADAMITANYDKAIQLLQNIISNDEFSYTRESAKTAITTVNLLKSIDLIASAEKTSADPVSKIPDTDNIPPLLRAIIALRNNNEWEAMNYLEKSEGQFLYEELRARAKMNDKELETEKAAMQNFAEILREISGEPVTVIPLPEKCLALLERIIPNNMPANITKWSNAFLKCREKYLNTSFVNKYSEVFDSMQKLYGISQLKTANFAGLGNGRIIQVTNNNYYVESAESLPNTQGYSVGLIKTDDIFLSAQSGKPLGALISIYAVRPINNRLSEKQLVFSLLENVEKPKVEERVVIGKDIQAGPQFIKIERGLLDAAGKLIFHTDFSGNLERNWTGVAGALKNIDGKLYLNAYSQKAKPELKRSAEGDLELNVIIGTEPYKIEFDLIRETKQALSVAVGNLQFVIGGYGIQKEGIYLHGKLVRKAVFSKTEIGSTQHILISRTGPKMSFSIDKENVEYTFNTSEKPEKIDKIQFMTHGSVFLDNVAIIKPSVIKGNRITGFNTGKNKVILSKDNDPSLQALIQGSKVFFFKENSSGTLELAGSAVINQLVDNYLICSIEKDKGLSGDCVVSPSSTPLSQKSDIPAVPIEESTRQASDSAIVYGIARTNGNKLIIEPDIFSVGSREETLPSEGYIHPAAMVITQPETKEVLAVYAGEAQKCKFRNLNEMIICEPAENTALANLSGKQVLLSSRPLIPNRKIDLAGITLSSYRQLSPSSAGRPFWVQLSGQWVEKSGHMAKSTSRGADNIASLIMPDAFADNVQYDIDITITADGKQSKLNWVKDVMLELFFPARQAGITFGLGTTDSGGGITVCGRTASLSLEKDKFTTRGVLPRDAVIYVEKGWLAGQPAMKKGYEYKLRIRKIKDVLAFYVNGKRLAYVNYPGIEGDAHLLLTAPEASVTVNNTTARNLPKSCLLPSNEPALGEFGYVLNWEEPYIIIDSDMNGISIKDKVSIVSIESVIEGTESKTFVMKRVASATITEIGTRTAKAVCSDLSEPIKPGMKIITGAQPKSFYITQERLNNIDQGL